MMWRCALIQRQLPDYPDGDLSPFWKRLVAAHLKVCPDCRRELVELTEVMRLYEAHPLPDPGPAFWEEFDRELHLKLAQVNQSPEPAPWRLRLPHYLVGATALAGILILAVYLGPFSPPSSGPQLAQRQEAAKAPAEAVPPETRRAKEMTPTVPGPPPPAMAKRAAPDLAPPSVTPPALLAKPEAAPAGEADINLAAIKPGQPQGLKGENGEEGLWADDDVLSWDVDTVVSDLSRQEREDLKRRLESGR